MAKAGLNIINHTLEFVLSDCDSQQALLKLGIYYLGDRNWKLPQGARAKFLGHVKYNVGIGNNVILEEDDNWLITVDGKEYYVWTIDSAE